MSSPTDWSHFYKQNLSNQEPVFGQQTYDDDTNVGITTTAEGGSVPASSSGGGNLTPEGRVGKPARKRSRASRRTPTTLFNTDTTNFRAMVQQFTGGTTFTQGSGSARPAGPAFEFSFGGHQHHLNTGSLTVPSAGFQLLYQQQQQQNQAYMFSLNSADDYNLRARDPFLQRLEANPIPNMEVVSEGFVSSQVPPSRTRSSSENRNRTSFMF